MILAPLSHAARYTALHPRLATAFAWLAAHPELPDGRHVIDGDDLFAIAERGVTRDQASARLESHRTYLDIQVNRLHGELMGWAPVAVLSVFQPFQEGGDIAFYDGQPSSLVRVDPGLFAIFWPEDGHMPLLHPAGRPVDYRKVVVKVRI